MPSPEDIVRQVYDAAEVSKLNVDTFVSLFARDGYFLDMASGKKWVGLDVDQAIKNTGALFPDFHRELLHMSSTTDGQVVVELKLQGARQDKSPAPVGGGARATGARFDVPCCDVFRLENGKVKSFHCYNML